MQQEAQANLQSKADLQEAQDTIQRMQEELKSIKQERKRAELGSMGSFKSKRGGGSAKRSAAKKKAFGQSNAGDMEREMADVPSALPLSTPPQVPPASGRGKETRVSVPHLNVSGEV